MTGGEVGAPVTMEAITPVMTGTIQVSDMYIGVCYTCSDRYNPGDMYIGAC